MRVIQCNLIIISVFTHPVAVPRRVRAAGWCGPGLCSRGSVERRTHIRAQTQTVKPSVLKRSCVLPLSAPLRVRLQPCLHCNVGHLIGRREFSIVHPSVRGALLKSVEVSSVCGPQHAARRPKCRTLRLSYSCRFRCVAFGLHGSVLIA